MPKSIYEYIYKSIKKDIISSKYKYGDYLPSENEYTKKFSCSRNTIRRALSLLVHEGFLIPQHGKGVQVIYNQHKDQSVFLVGDIETFAESAKRNKVKVSTNVVTFKTIIIDEELSLKSGFSVGDEVYYIERVRKINNENSILDINMFLKSEVKDLTKEIARHSIYDYLENVLHMTITTSNRFISAQKATPLDKKYLSLNSNDFILLVEGRVFNSRCVMFEYTQARHVPYKISFTETSIRKKSL